MSEYVIKVIDERPTLKVVDDRPLVKVSAPGPQGPAGGGVAAGHTWFYLDRDESDGFITPDGVSTGDLGYDYIVGSLYSYNHDYVTGVDQPGWNWLADLFSNDQYTWLDNNIADQIAAALADYITISATAPSSPQLLDLWVEADV